MPFNLSAKIIVILKYLHVLRCENCGEYGIEDPIMEKVDQSAGLGIVRFVA